MADIFLSYAREDEARARALAEVLERRGWTVFWDWHIPHGSDFTDHIQGQLQQARCIVVLWSNASVGSKFVRDEAREGVKDGRLRPAFIERVEPPLGFRGIHTADLIDWHGDPSHSAIERLLSSIRKIVPPNVQAIDRSAAGELAPPISETPVQALGAIHQTAKLTPAVNRDPAHTGKLAPLPRRTFRASWLFAAVATVLIAVAVVTVWRRPERASDLDAGHSDSRATDVFLPMDTSTDTSQKTAHIGDPPVVTPTTTPPSAPARSTPRTTDTGAAEKQPKLVIEQLVIEEERLVILTEQPFNREISIYVGQVEDGAGLVVVLPTGLLAEYFPKLKASTSPNPTLEVITGEAWRLLDADKSVFNEGAISAFVRGRCLADRSVAWNGIGWLQFFHRGVGYQLWTNAAVNRGHNSQLAFKLIEAGEPGPFSYATQELCNPSAAPPAGAAR